MVPYVNKLESPRGPSNPIYPRMLCVKIGWNWPSGSGEEYFKIPSTFLRYFVIISPWERAWSFISRNLNLLYPRMLCAKFDGIRPSGSREKDFQTLSMYFPYFVITCISVAFILRYSNTLHLRMLYAEFQIGWNWTRGSWEEDENVKSL